jgi:hypothetical protein
MDQITQAITGVDTGNRMSPSVGRDRQHHCVTIPAKLNAFINSYGAVSPDTQGAISDRLIVRLDREGEFA